MKNKETVVCINTSPTILLPRLLIKCSFPLINIQMNKIQTPNPSIESLSYVNQNECNHHKSFCNNFFPSWYYTGSQFSQLSLVLFLSNHFKNYFLHSISLCFSFKITMLKCLSINKYFFYARFFIMQSPITHPFK